MMIRREKKLNAREEKCAHIRGCVRERDHHRWSSKSQVRSSVVSGCCSTTSRLILSSEAIAYREEVPFSTLIHLPHVTFLKRHETSDRREETSSMDALVRCILCRVYSEDAWERTCNSQNYALLWCASKDGHQRRSNRIEWSIRARLTSNPCGSLSK